ncbi:sigma-70 family RNA polymerase sigma factor [Kitasatospora sp. NBC_01560]|uniref:sigma-70 family RNA polymerase sigma factor n=1 Tax=Kitasatospora sp. NBC_01560 TaxID=2975965 RepID=UPI00386F0516
MLNSKEPFMPRDPRPLSGSADSPPTPEADGSALCDGSAVPGEEGAGTEGPAPESDARLTARLRSGDDRVVAELYERHHKAALSYARIVTGRADSAEDLASEAFARTLAAVRTGSGPDENWRPYLLAVVRNTAMAWSTAERRTLLTSDFGDWADRQERVLAPDELFAATAERHLVAEAYQSLPERWRTVLWHAVIEQRAAEEIAPLLGLTPSGVSSLASRAREGLREAYLVAHVRRAASAECEAYAPEIAASVHRPSKRMTKRLARHLDECRDCRSCLEEMRDVNRRLRAAGLGALVLWDGGHSPGAGAGGGSPVGAAHRFGAGHGAKAAIGAAVAGVAATAVLVTLATGSGPAGPRSDGPDPAAPSAPQVRIEAAAAPTRATAATTATLSAPSTASGSPGRTAPSVGPAPTASTAAPGTASPSAARTSAASAKSTAATGKGGAGGLSAGVYSAPGGRTPDPGDRVVRLRLAAPGTCVEAEDVDTVDEVAPYLNGCSGATFQSWYLRPEASGTGYAVTSAGNGGCLDSTGAASAAVVQHPCRGSAGQVWQTVSLPGGGTGLQHRQSGQLLGAQGTGAVDETLRLFPQACGGDVGCRGKVSFQL